MHGAMALFETARTDVEMVHKENDRQRLKQLDVALQTIATQATRKPRLAAGKSGKALAWFERGSTAGKLTPNAQLDSALKEEKSEKQKTSCSRRRSAFACTAMGGRGSTRHGQARRTRPWERWRTWRVG